jgi:phage terminase small subunit
MNGRKPTPSNLVALRGNPGKRRPRNRAPTPAAGTPDKPPWVARSKIASEAWDSIVPQLETMGVLTQADELALEVLVGVYADWRRKRTAALAARFQSLLAEFGLTPSARTRLHVPGKKESGYGSFRSSRSKGRPGA